MKANLNKLQFGPKIETFSSTRGNEENPQERINKMRNGLIYIYIYSHNIMLEIIVRETNREREGGRKGCE